VLSPTAMGQPWRPRTARTTATGEVDPRRARAPAPDWLRLPHKSPELRRLAPASEAAVTGGAECRGNAAECMRLSQMATDTKLKAHLLSMARTWTALAIQTERLEAMLKEQAGSAQQI
jgi:hypothetical protein